MLGRPLIEDLVAGDTGNLAPVVVVTDNGPCYKASRFAAGRFASYIRSWPELEHIRSRHRSHPPPVAREQRDSSLDTGQLPLEGWFGDGERT